MTQFWFAFAGYVHSFLIDNAYYVSAWIGYTVIKRLCDCTYFIANLFIYVILYVKVHWLTQDWGLV